MTVPMFVKNCLRLCLIYRIVTEALEESVTRQYTSIYLRAEEISLKSYDFLEASTARSWAHLLLLAVSSCHKFINVARD